MKTVFLIVNSTGWYWVNGMNFTENIYNATQFDKYEIAENVIQELFKNDFKNVEVPLFFQIEKFFTNK